MSRLSEGHKIPVAAEGRRGDLVEGHKIQGVAEKVKGRGVAAEGRRGGSVKIEGCGLQADAVLIRRSGGQGKGQRGGEAVKVDREGS